jgi:hypothetical protein
MKGWALMQALAMAEYSPGAKTFLLRAELPGVTQGVAALYLRWWCSSRYLAVSSPCRLISLEMRA